MLKLRRVTGHSMTPWLKDGQIVLFRKSKAVARGEIVLVGGQPEIVKLVSEVKEHKVFLVGKDRLHDVGWRDKSEIQAKLIWPRELQRL